MLNKFNTFIIIVALTALTIAVKGQTAEDSIKAVINKTFVGLIHNQIIEKIIY